MPMVMAHAPTSGREYGLRAVAAGAAVFGLLRLNWTAAHVVLPFTLGQGALAAALFGPPTAAVVTTLDCSGADTLAFCLGAVLAYPVPWRQRLIGAAAGAVLILGLNTLRIGTLGRVATSPGWFDALHLYMWPAALTLAVAGFVFTWMRHADRDGLRALTITRPHPSRRFIVFAIGFLLLFVAASPLYLGSPAILTMAAFVARLASAVLVALGISAHVEANVLSTQQGAFLVTQECVATPLIPIYLAAVCAYARTRPRLLLGLAAALPLFLALSVARLLVVALPGVVASPAFAVHAFYQFVSGIVVIALAARWRHRDQGVLQHAAGGLASGALCLWLLGPSITRMFAAVSLLPTVDSQGAGATLPAFQISLFLALWVAAFLASGWKRFAAGLVLLIATQVAGLLVLQALSTHAGFWPHVRDVRAWAVTAPILVCLTVVHVARTRR